jgi:hypothetical protein
MKKVILLVVLLAATIAGATIAGATTAAAADGHTLTSARAKAVAADYGQNHIAQEPGILDYDVLHCKKAGHNRFTCEVHIAFDDTGTPPGADCYSVLTVKFKSSKSNKVVAVEGVRDCNH